MLLILLEPSKVVSNFMTNQSTSLQEYRRYRKPSIEDWLREYTFENIDDLEIVKVNAKGVHKLFIDRLAMTVANLKVMFGLLDLN